MCRRAAGRDRQACKSFCSLPSVRSPRSRSHICSDPVSQSFLHASWSRAEQEAACLGAKSVTLGRQPGTGLVRRQVLQPWLPLLSKPVPPSWGEAAFVSSSGCYSQDRRARVHTASRAGAAGLEPGCSGVRCPLRWELRPPVWCY